LEETAGPSEHPAELLKVPPSEADEPFVFLEKVGVSDPESDRLSGRTFVSRALRNLVSDMGNSTLPDLILHRGSTAIKEYKNPELMPGMFPMLWPFGIGGFENPVRSVSLSFPVQANYYFDLPDRSFRTHNSFLFVALNIIQQRAAHLHTHCSAYSYNGLSSTIFRYRLIRMRIGPFLMYINSLIAKNNHHLTTLITAP
jgi:hypothetical protein